MCRLIAVSFTLVAVLLEFISNPTTGPVVLRTAFIVLLAFVVAFNFCAKNLLKYWYPAFLAASLSPIVPDLSRFPTSRFPPSTAATLYLVLLLPWNKLAKLTPPPSLAAIWVFIESSIPPSVVKLVAFFKLNATTLSDLTFILVLESKVIGKGPVKSTSKAVDFPSSVNWVPLKFTFPPLVEYTA